MFFHQDFKKLWNDHLLFQKRVIAQDQIAMSWKNI